MIGSRLPFDAREMPVSVLAYIGDAVYELYVRLHVAQVACGGSGDLHRKSIGFVSARSQADAMRRLLPLLTEAEASVYRRSRNHQSGSLPKNADPVTYRIATGFEGLIGYLYVNGLEERLDELMRIVLQPESAAAPDAATVAAMCLADFADLAPAMPAMPSMPVYVPVMTEQPPVMPKAASDPDALPPAALADESPAALANEPPDALADESPADTENLDAPHEANKETNHEV